MGSSKANYMMRKYLVYIVLSIASFWGYAQNNANFFPLNDQKTILCYTERESGSPLKNTTVEFRNNSQCNGSCMYVWDFGDNSPQLITTDDSNVNYTYATDGVYSVSLSVVNTTLIHDTIKNRPIRTVESQGVVNDSIVLLITYQAVDNIDRIAHISLPQSHFSKKSVASQITVYSPYVSDNNFTYEIIDPSSESQIAPIQSFTYNLQVDNTAFTPHAPDYWIYYWYIYATDADGKPTKTITEFKTDSLSYQYTFPLENFNPGYLVKLKIALDSTKFDDEQILTYHNLENCVYSKQQIIPVTDYFFTESTRKEKDIKKREAHIPNIFTPGGNDENEVFYFNTTGSDIFKIYIYNSWGSLVYTQEAHAITWTGKDNSGKDCPSGTYYYVVFSDNTDKRHETAGYIHLFRQN